jgi:hypothetical protein
MSIGHNDFILKNITLDNYNGLVNPKEHVQNLWNSLELVIWDSEVCARPSWSCFMDSLKHGIIEFFFKKNKLVET